MYIVKQFVLMEGRINEARERRAAPLNSWAAMSNIPPLYVRWPNPPGSLSGLSFRAQLQEHVGVVRALTRAIQILK